MRAASFRKPRSLVCLQDEAPFLRSVVLRRARDRLRSYGASSVRILFIRMAFPDPVLKYFSNSRAFLSVGRAMYATSISGLRAFVD